MQYSKIIYLDSDALVLQNLDHLFELPVDFAASPDIGWPDIFNSGVFLATPNMGTCAALSRLASAGVSFDGGDQGLLNTYFKNWHRLSFTYNCTPSSGYQYQPAFKHFESQLKVAHFIGDLKPWRVGGQKFDGAYGRLLARWWAVHDNHVHTPSTKQPVIEEKKDGPQAAGLSFINFKNTWDEPRSSISSLSIRTPKSVHFERTPNPIFPWEGKHTSERVFPNDPIKEVHTVREFNSPDIDESVPETIQFSNAWDHSSIQQFVTSGISSAKRDDSIWGSGTHTPREPEVEGHESPGTRSTFDVVASGVPDPATWDPTKAVDKLADHAQSLADAARRS